MKVKCNLYTIRKKKNLKQTDLSKMTGLSQKALSEIETGKSKGVSFNTLLSLCDVLNITIGELFEVTQDEQEEESNIVVVEKPFCSFCGKKENDVDLLIMGKATKDRPKVYICSECINRCNKLINNDKK
ncbi:MAG: helix-turn-helix domain-containing protein [Candidatus Sericytochromatia bacterium]